MTALTRLVLLCSSKYMILEDHEQVITIKVRGIALSLKIELLAYAYANCQLALGISWHGEKYAHHHAHACLLTKVQLSWAKSKSLHIKSLTPEVTMQ